MPIVRTFAPFVAGIGKMEYRRFALYNVVGAVAWVTLCLLSGYCFGNIEWVKRNFSVVTWRSCSSPCCRWRSSSFWPGGSGPRRPRTGRAGRRLGRIDATAPRALHRV